MPVMWRFTFFSNKMQAISCIYCIKNELHRLQMPSFIVSLEKQKTSIERFAPNR